jgi:hypothetical protein
MRLNDLSRTCLPLIVIATASSIHMPASVLTTTAAAQSIGDLVAGAGDVAYRPDSPKLMTARGLRNPTATEARILAGSPIAAFKYDCSVGFDDPAALAALPDAAQNTFAYAPWWFQYCGGGLLNYAVVRPLEYGHYHLAYEDASISCVDPNTGLFGRIQPDMSCSSAGIDHTMEPRYVAPHIGDERVHLYVVNQYVNPSDPYSDSTYDKKPFDLKRLRVLAGSPPVRVCYKKVQEINGPWLAAPDVPLDGSTPGVWLCWNQLGPALWDLSPWATNVREVKVTATDGASVFSIDDFLIGVQ